MKNVTYINAGAGSGKTHTLTQTLTQLIKEGKVKPDQVILTTFTTKAANEFKEKAKAFLFNEGLYNEALQLDHAMIGTVHSVCQRMIGKYWFNLGLTPNMGVMAEEDTTFYISQSLSSLPTDEEIKRLHYFARYFNVREYVDGKPMGMDYNFWQKHLSAVIGYATNYEIDDFTRSEEESLRFIRQFVNNNADINFTREELIALLNQHEAFLKSKKQSKTNDERIEVLKNARTDIDDPSLLTLGKINDTIGTPKGYGSFAAAFQERFNKVWTSEGLYKKQEEYIKLIFNLAQRWVENFAQFKREKNLLDYNDMEKYMRALTQDSSIAQEIAQSYRYLFVDEFQDSSPIQVKIFDSLSDIMEHSYWVGDYKQAIYGFRGSDIVLTKSVVDRVAKHENGCQTESLTKSWRSLPDIVDVNNNIFERTFADVLSKENIHLDKVRENNSGECSIQFFNTGEEPAEINGLDIGHYVNYLLLQGVKPNEIAVLARTNAELVEITDMLTQRYIRVSRNNKSVVDFDSYKLVSALLNIVRSKKDAIAKATVALLTEPDFYTEKIIEEKILNSVNPDAKEEDFLADVPLVDKVLSIRPQLQQLSVAELVESMIIELNLNDVLKCGNDNLNLVPICLQTIISTARTYEQHCVQMNMPATIDGFISYIETLSPVCPGDPRGVQLHTYHSCKGLQWKYVILTSLNNDVANINKAVRNITYGVHAIHSAEATSENPYPEVYVRVTPWIFGTKRNIPEDITKVVTESDYFKSEYKASIAEANRLLYVGMTRAQDVLILHINEPRKKPLRWAMDVGIDTIASEIPSFDDCDLFGTGDMFTNITLTNEQIIELGLFRKDEEKYDDDYDDEEDEDDFDEEDFDKDDECDEDFDEDDDFDEEDFEEEEDDEEDNVDEDDNINSMALNIPEHTCSSTEPRYISPSKDQKTGIVTSHHNFKQRIPLASPNAEMSIVGNCVHQIFAAIEDSCSEPQDIRALISSYGLGNVLCDSDAIKQAWDNLTQYLTATYGPAVKVYHERPFRYEHDGHTMVGSIDLVWATADGDILIDFKSCPMGAEAVLNADSDHYAGHYAGQLSAYTQALQAAGEKVIKSYIYYPVNGILAEVQVKK